MAKSVYWESCCCRGSGLALILLVIGLFWLAKDMGWITTNVSLWAILLIVLGAYWFISSMFKKTC
jgi:hypothetical protein